MKYSQININSLNLHSFNSITSPLDQFEIRNLIGIDAPLFGNLSLSLTNIGLYLTISLFILLLMSVLSTNNDKIISNKFSISLETVYATVHGIVTSQINNKNGQIYFPLMYTLFVFILITCFYWLQEAMSKSLSEGKKTSRMKSKQTKQAGKGSTTRQVTTSKKTSRKNTRKSYK